jgi:putative ABC transport system permease protein
MPSTSWLSDLADDVRFGFRTLRKNPGFTAVAVLTLALGIGANTAIFSVIENVLLRPLPYVHPEALVEVWNTYPNFQPVGLSPGDYVDWHRDAKSFSAMGGYAGTETSVGYNLTGVGEPERIQAAFLSSDLLAVLGLRPVVGHGFLPEQDQLGGAPEVLLSHHYWQRRFGADPGVVGRTIALDDRKYTIAGVLPAAFQLNRTMDLWLPLRDYPDILTSHIHHGLVAVARLKPDVTAAQAQAEIDALNRQEAVAYPDSHKSWGALVRPLQDPSAAKLRTTLLVLFGAVGLVLLIACANIANLLLARNAAREREMALRTALGANQWRLVRQLLTESTLLALASGVVGMALAALGIRVLGALAPPELSVVGETSLDSRVLLFTVAVCGTTGVLCGLLPAVQVGLTDLNSVLKQGSKGSGGPGSHGVHNALVVSEVALALVPLIGAGLLLRSFRQLLDVAPGFQTEHILTMQITQAIPPIADLLKLSNDEQLALGKKQAIEFQQILDQVKALPGVKSAAGISTLPLQSALREASRFVIEGHPIYEAGVRPVAQIRTITPDYFATVGIPLLEGRAFTPHDWGQQNIVINDTLARHFFGDEDPLGHRMNFCSLDSQPCWNVIVGVVGNVHQFGLDAGPTYDAYFTGAWTQRLVLRTASDPAATAAAASEAVHRLDPTLPVTEVTTLDGLLSTSLSPRRFAAVLTAVFAGLAMVLSAVGIYGVMSYTVGQRTQEIGIRLALGAQPGNMLALILGRGARLASAGIALGLLGALALTRFLSSLLYGVHAKDPLTFIGVAAMLMAVALLACYVPARRAMKVDPTVALRYE